MAWNDTLEFRKIDQKVIKSLSSDTRVKMLKKLSDRRKMPTELAKEMNLAASTIVEHLKELEGAGLVKRQETQHKWIYYELTDKGSDIFKPKIPFQFILMMTFGILIAGLSFWNYNSMIVPIQATDKTYESKEILSIPAAASVGAENTEQAGCVYPDLMNNEILIILIVIGIILATYAAYSIYKIKKR